MGVSKQSGWSFLGLFSHGSTKTKYTKMVNKTFVQWSTSSYSLVGGNPSVPADQWPAWVRTIHGNLAPLRYSFAPLSSLVQGTKSSEMESAITSYLKVNQAQADHQALVLSKKDPHTMPSWCKGYP